MEIMEVFYHLACSLTIVAAQGVLEIGDTVSATVVSFNDMWVELTVDGGASVQTTVCTALLRQSKNGTIGLQQSIVTFGNRWNLEECEAKLAACTKLSHGRRSGLAMRKILEKWWKWLMMWATAVEPRLKPLFVCFPHLSEVETSKDLSQMEVQHPQDLVRKGEKVRCFVKQFLGDMITTSN